MAKKIDVAEEDPLAGAWSTEDLDKIRLTGGKLPEEGIIIVPETMDTKEGKNGEFRVVAGTKDGKACDLVFSSAKLTKIFDTHWAEMKGQKVLVSGYGSGFDRQYKVKLV